MGRMSRTRAKIERTGKSEFVTIGLRAKTARAIAVVLGGSIDSPQIIAKTELKLADSDLPATAQPYHEVMDLTWPQSQAAVKAAARQIESIARTVLRDLIEKLQKDGKSVTAAAIIGARDRDLARIGNSHIRAHAAEGILFRHVLDTAVDDYGLRRETFADRDFDRIAKLRLGPQFVAIDESIRNLRRAVPAPWRTDERQAAMAAWLVLHNR